MNASDTYALLLIGMPLLTVACLASGVKSPISPKRKRLVMWAALWGTMLIVFLASVRCMCFESHSLMPALIGVPCMIITLAYSSRRFLAGVSVSILIVAILGLKYQYNDLVHSSNFTSGSHAQSPRNRIQKQGCMTVMRKMIAKNHVEGQHQSAGWVADWPWVAEESDEAQRSLRLYHQFEAKPFWHSSFTRLYKRTTAELAPWWPGGKLDENLDKLEFHQHDVP